VLDVVGEDPKRRQKLSSHKHRNTLCFSGQCAVRGGTPICRAPLVLPAQRSQWTLMSGHDSD